MPPLLEYVLNAGIVLIILWVASAIICGNIAEKNGHSGFGWGCLGLLLGPITFLLIFLVPSNYKAMERRDIEKGLMRRCPRCREWIQKEANLCRHCGSELASLEG